MDTSTPRSLDSCIASLPRDYPGPGGAVAVLRNGAVLERHAWGFANAERGIPFTPRTLFRLCSITKQFTCALVLDSGIETAALDEAVRARLRLLGQGAPGALHLCHNQSGLRDYWALAMLLGSAAEAPFGHGEAGRLIAATRSLQFDPGTRYSYCNQNFRILSDILEERGGRSFAELLRSRIFDRVGMGSAFLAADTRAMPDATEGYEGTQATGFRPAENRILWTGDAGLGASLDDMIAWERHIHATRDDAASLHARLAAPVRFADGAEASYGFGLGRGVEFGRTVLGHGGALRGWRSHRLHVPSERISVVVLFNHLSDAYGAAVALLAATLGETRPVPSNDLPDPPWLGAWREPETGLSVRIDRQADGRVRLRYGHVPELLQLHRDGTAGNGRTRLVVASDGVWMERPHENHRSRLERLEDVARTDIAGRYACDELAAELLVADAGGALYGSFAGPLGQGRMELLEPIGGDHWALPCPRALDHTPPGDWTLRFLRAPGGAVEGVEVGCWLARGLRYVRVAR